MNNDLTIQELAAKWLCEYCTEQDGGTWETEPQSCKDGWMEDVAKLLDAMGLSWREFDINDRRDQKDLPKELDNRR